MFYLTKGVFMLLPFLSKYSGVIQRRRLLAQGYILILLCTVSSETATEAAL